MKSGGALRGMKIPCGWTRVGSEPRRALADGEAEVVAGGELWEVTGHAGDVAIAAQDLVERERLAEMNQGRSYMGGPPERRDPPGRP